jgi:CrcB protein
MKELFAIAVGGAAGAVARYLVRLLADRYVGQEFPWGTFFVNVAGCFLLGIVAAIGMARRDVPAYIQHGVAIGFLGALTTFSTFGFETFRRMEDGKWALAFSNIAANLLIGLLAVWLGLLLGKSLFGVAGE